MLRKKCDRVQWSMDGLVRFVFPLVIYSSVKCGLYFVKFLQHIINTACIEEVVFGAAVALCVHV